MDKKAAITLVLTIAQSTNHMNKKVPVKTFAKHSCFFTFAVISFDAVGIITTLGIKIKDQSWRTCVFVAGFVASGAGADEV